FINPPLNSLSGALNPIEAMPHGLQPFTVPNPILHCATVERASMLKGSGIPTLWPNFLGLLLVTLALVTLSVWKFRKQLSKATGNRERQDKSKGKSINQEGHEGAGLRSEAGERFG